MFAWKDEAKRAVVCVGGGRGFIVRSRGPLGWGERRLVVTAAHCLPRLPPPHGASHTEERTYRRLLGKLGKRATVWAECLFVDPVADIAVLGQPDDQSFPEEDGRYDGLVEAAEPLVIGDIGPQDPHDLHSTQRTWALSLKGDWIEHGAYHTGGRSSLMLEGEIAAGMSGSPIIDDLGCAIAAVSTGNAWNPRLTQSLPVWVPRGRFRARWLQAADAEKAIAEIAP